jgi:ApaG protein
MNSNFTSGSYTLTTQNITVKVTPFFLPHESNINSGNYCFSYTIVITNLNSEGIKLLNRHWKIFSGGRQIGDVKGEGVIGQQPIIEPNENYEYTSHTVINHHFGSMKGTYTFISRKSEFLYVEIPEFFLLYATNEQFH